MRWMRSTVDDMIGFADKVIAYIRGLVGHQMRCDERELRPHQARCGQRPQCEREHCYVPQNACAELTMHPSLFFLLPCSYSNSPRWPSHFTAACYGAVLATAAQSSRSRRLLVSHSWKRGRAPPKTGAANSIPRTAQSPHRS